MPSLVRSLFLCAALAACSDPSPSMPIDAGADIDAPPRQIITETVPLVPGELAEAILTGGPADLAIIHLEAPVAELDWNLHGHAGGDTQTVYEELNRMTADYVFRPTAQADWWLLLRNSGPTAMDVAVRVELYGGMLWTAP